MIDPRPLDVLDSQLASLIQREVERQNTHIQLIASENAVGYATMQAVGSVLANKYSEGYPGRRYYEGCDVVDEIETLAIERAKELFGADHANVQPHSGSQANMAAYLAFLEPGDTILGMRLDQGGHLTHGSPVNFSGLLFNVVAYGVDAENERIDMDEVRRLAHEHRPKMIVVGYSNYSRIPDFAAFRQVADEVGAILLADMAHVIGLIAGGAHPNPMPYVDVVTATTHKALRGPRGGLILCRAEHAKAIDKAVFPVSQGGAINHQIAAKALCFKDSASADFARYAHQVVANAAAMADALTAAGVRIVSGGTDNHMFSIDLRSIDPELTGKEAATLLDRVGITLNRNSIPFDPRSPFITSGLRIGTPTVTTAGMGEAEMVRLAELLHGVLVDRDDETRLKEHERGIADLAAEFPLYPAGFSGYVG